MFFKSNTDTGIISPNASCPGIGCSYTCKEGSTDEKTTEKVAADENKASVKNSGSSPSTGG